VCSDAVATRAQRSGGKHTRTLRNPQPTSADILPDASRIGPNGKTCAPAKTNTGGGRVGGRGRKGQAAMDHQNGALNTRTVFGPRGRSPDRCPDLTVISSVGPTNPFLSHERLRQPRRSDRELGVKMTFMLQTVRAAYSSRAGRSTETKGAGPVSCHAVCLPFKCHKTTTCPEDEILGSYAPDFLSSVTGFGAFSRDVCCAQSLLRRAQATLPSVVYSGGIKVTSRPKNSNYCSWPCVGVSSTGHASNEKGALPYKYV